MAHLAQLNIARTRAPLDDPTMAEFVALLPTINGLAEVSPGFVWRLKDEYGDATAIRLFDDPLLIVNMSVWEDLAALSAFLFQADHKEAMSRRRLWFEHLPEPYSVIWCVPEGHIPTLEEGRERLLKLRAEGPTVHAFTFRESHLEVEAATMADEG